ncbi:TFIIH subunit Tfb4/p34 [Piptocephalis cylindrospora]|uniref:General transcription and DNA repair factor IIH subunit TFB4 n=1 Tax=Piptocephalis cylindrospora TaxID=1907219 RepID=A0A4V1IYQ2_9FUNG|nr:TFIIH subunit Tfb4/p34 [Piptocephalis cylindrospora]|eukprot:RKP15349.1 TFIIH subunit Tfb4/p34 [Piptocephalis cylindrospora]
MAGGLDGKTHARILLLSLSPDVASQYVPLMNCIFSAQKAGIPVDVCKLGASKASFLQQAAHITSGYYAHITPSKTMLQHLMFTFLPDHRARGILRPPERHEVDFRAACFCHRKVIDSGYVCSVCLSIFCDRLAQCSTCGMRFPEEES